MCRWLLVLTLCGAAAGAEPKKDEQRGRDAISWLLSGRFSVSVLWGAAFSTGASSPSDPPPIYLGGEVSYWLVERYILDLHVSHSFNTRRTNVLLGPRFRSWTRPIAASIGIQAGVIEVPVGGPRFGLSPIASLDMVLGGHFLAALEGAVDVPIGANGVVLRVGLNLGWRF